MSFATATSRAASNDPVNRRLAAGVMLSIVVHAMLLLIRFGIPGLGLPTPFTPRSVTVTLAPPVPPQQVVEQVAEPLAPPAPPAPSGMRLVAPAPRSAPLVAAKPKPVKPRRISRRLVPLKPVEAPTPVIAQDQNLNNSFVVPQQQPQEAARKTIDPKEAQEGVDDGAELRAAQQLADAKLHEEMAAAAAADEQAAQEVQAKLLAAKQAEEDSRRQAQEASRVVADTQAQQRRAEQAALQQQTEQVARQTAAERTVQQTAEQSLRQQAAELTAQQKAEEAARQKAAQLAAQQTAEEALRQKAVALAAQQKAEEAARREAEEVAVQQKAVEAARQQAEQAARRQAEQAAAGQRERDRASATANSGAGIGGAGTGGSGTAASRNLFGSDAANRVRELTRGIELLSGEPPRARAADRGGRRIVIGAGERDVPLRMYVDSFRQKIERNGGVAFSPLSADRVRIEPLVSVAIRSDGSVEDVTIVRSSGQTETDNMVRRIVHLNARYSAFPPNIASRYDVIEIQRIWSFAETLRLLEELR